MKCYLHTEREPVAECVSCRQHVCQECDVVLGRRHYCKKCLAEAERVAPEAMSTSSSGGVAVARPVKRMWRSREDRVVAGVCGGFAKYAELDPAMVRIFYVMIALFTGIGILAYPIAVLAIPQESSGPS
jgi:phage shock protein C